MRIIKTIFWPAAAIHLCLASAALAQLNLSITLDTGFTEIRNASSDAVVFDGYSVASPSGQLAGTWLSLEAQGIGGWEKSGDSNAQRRTELNPLSDTSVAPGSSLGLGNLYTPIPGLGNDVTFQYTQPSGLTTFGSVNLGTALTLTVDRGTGETILQNRTGGSVEIDGYTVASASGSLAGGDAWMSLSEQLPGWDEADNSDNSRVTEFNPGGASTIDGNEEISLGSLYAPTPPAAIGDALPDDLTFAYTSPTGASLTGSVVYDGAMNNIVLTINPATGEATIQNQSPYFDVDIDGYSISSVAGSLNPSNWSSLESQGAVGWDQADASDTFRLTELNPVGETTLDGGGRTLNLGNPFDAAEGIDLNDLSFEYLVAGGDSAAGLIVFAELATGCVIPPDGILGDFDGNGTVEFADFLTLSANFGLEVDTYEEGDADCNGIVEFADFLTLSANFGTSVGGSVSSVPEPCGSALISVAILPLLSLRRSREK